MSNISIAEASRQLSQIINRASYGGEVLILTSRGRPKAVLLGIESFQQILGIEFPQQNIPVKEFQQKFREALAEAGYITTEDIIDLVRQVKQEMAEENLPEIGGSEAK